MVAIGQQLHKEEVVVGVVVTVLFLLPNLLLQQLIMRNCENWKGVAYGKSKGRVVEEP